ncbi:MAG: hypothetical protein ACI4JC_09750 [Faecalibacterium sp.]
MACFHIKFMQGIHLCPVSESSASLLGASLSLYEKVFEEVTAEPLLEHAYLSAANAALAAGNEARAIKILEQSRERLPEGRNVRQAEMLADIIAAPGSCWKNWYPGDTPPSLHA